MSSYSLPQLCTLIVIVIHLFSQSTLLVQAGNCFLHRADTICYTVSETDTNEDACTGPYYSDDKIQELDGIPYAEKCREVNVTPQPCNYECELGEECQWIHGEPMCVCSEASCAATNGSSSNIEHHPVCASNNMTFSSLCAMEAWKCFNHRSALYKKYDGECQKDCQNVRCPENNICLLVQNTGEPICYPKTHCNPDLDPEPVCGTDGITYPNICIMRLSPNRQGQTPELAHKGPCETDCRSDLCGSDERCVYSKDLRPICIRCEYSSRFLTHSGECSANVEVCGDDGKSYNNYCSLLMARCKNNQYIRITGYGTCSTTKKKKLSRNKSKYVNSIPYMKMN